MNEPLWHKIYLETPTPANPSAGDREIYDGSKFTEGLFHRNFADRRNLTNEAQADFFKYF